MTTVTRAACRGCHGGCMYLLTVEDGRLVKAVPDPEGPLNRGRGCVKGMSIIEQVYQVLYEGRGPQEAIRSLMERPRRHESEYIWLLSR